MWDEEGDVIGVPGAAALYSSSMVRDVSIDDEFFDEDFFAYKEDVDVAWRSRLLGWKALYCPDAQAFHNRGWKKGARTKIAYFIIWELGVLGSWGNFFVIFKSTIHKRHVIQGKRKAQFENIYCYFN
ncbi:glycosyltransferase family 2 protein [Paenibacillus tyrfis]|uniref:glycosyltransferase family 2 protein n=1 Tax=Paenibacillus tyrfis TaxID=1501230 RepID=UPI0020A09057|nr:hypothetical protein [Paenibacillus tyrfis]MCP1309725.1 hypothetical protein [Paenibacillus tyrfis]